MLSAKCDLVDCAAYQILLVHLENPYQSLNSYSSPESTSLKTARRDQILLSFSLKNPKHMKTHHLVGNGALQENAGMATQRSTHAVPLKSSSLYWV